MTSPGAVLRHSNAAFTASSTRRSKSSPITALNGPAYGSSLAGSAASAASGSDREGLKTERRARSADRPPDSGGGDGADSPGSAAGAAIGAGGASATAS